MAAAVNADKRFKNKSRRHQHDTKFHFVTGKNRKPLVDGSKEEDLS
jgi:hypothetical protein